MSKRTVIALAVVAAALGAFIFFYEQHTLTSGELEARRNRLLPTFVRDRVTKLEIERGDERVVLVRERGEEDELGEWKLTEPVEAETDFDAVDSVMGALEWADARRKIDGVSAEDRRTFGLDAPRLRAFYTVADQRIPIAIGGEDPQGSGLYLALADEGVAYVVGKDLFEALDHDASWFRSKELLAAAAPSRAERVRIEGAAGERVLVKRDDRWWLEAPAAGRASGGVVSDMLRKLEDLSARRFVAEAPESLAQYGLDAPAHVVHLSRTRGDEQETVEATLRVGRACDEHEGEVYARVDEGPVVCVEADAVAPLGKTAEELRESRLVTVRDQEIERIEIASGASSLAVWREEGAWKLRARQGQRETEGEADAQAVADFMRALRGVTAESFIPADDAALRTHRLTNPIARLTLFLASEGDEEITETVALGRGPSAALFARRGEERAILALGEGADTLLDPSPARFRARRLVAEDAAEASRFVIRGATERTVIEKAEDAWRVVEPEAGEADAAAVRTLARALSTLDAERFVAEQATAEHGLSQPRWVVEARFESAPEDDHGHDHGEHEDTEERPATRDYVLRIGAETDGGAFARFGDERAIFVVDRALVEALSRVTGGSGANLEP